MSAKPSVVVAAMAANATIAVAKFGAGTLSGSSAMIAEGVHSLVDTGNQALLLLGVKRSQKRADATHPFGYGKELYFWSLLVAMLLFGIGGGLSFYEGIHHLRAPTPIESPAWSYAVLAIAAVAEGISLTLATRALLRESGDGLFAKLRRSKDPTRFVVFAEDSAALVGIAIAFAGVFAGERLGTPVPDALASMLIGMVLAGVAVFLVVECRNLLLGEGADAETIAAIEEVVRAKPYVETMERPLTMHFGPSEVLVNLEMAFRKERSAEQLACDVEELERAIRARCPSVKRIFIEAQALREGASGGREARPQG
ncbi:MAG TPA: cation diffusion facilitator family transporter [Myxococcota bacterium]|jgi:cation diffusion facilitator family transporter|nr:cation diffusion facilitator family transporter [Myxococcota bacterium]